MSFGPSNLLSWRDWVNYFYSGQFVDEVKGALSGTIVGLVGWLVTLGVGVIAYLGYKKRVGGKIAKWVVFIPVMFIAAARVLHTLYAKVSGGAASPGVEI